MKRISSYTSRTVMRACMGHEYLGQFASVSGSSELTESSLTVSLWTAVVV